jgi:hypothetical protein
MSISCASKAWLAWDACIAQQAPADGASGADSAQTHRQRRERGGTECDERGGDKHEDSADQSDSLRVTKPGSRARSDTLPSRRAEPVPDTCLSPHEFLKRLFGDQLRNRNVIKRTIAPLCQACCCNVNAVGPLASSNFMQVDFLKVH